jgi:hypothetical protein
MSHELFEPSSEVIILLFVSDKLDVIKYVPYLTRIVSPADEILIAAEIFFFASVQLNPVPLSSGLALSTKYVAGYVVAASNNAKIKMRKRFLVFTVLTPIM